MHGLCRMYWRVLLVVICMVAHRHFFAPPRCRTSQQRRSLWNDLGCLVFGGVGLAGVKSRAKSFLLALSVLSVCLLLFYFFSSFHWLVVWGWGLRIDRVSSLSYYLALLTYFNNNNNIILFSLMTDSCCMSKGFEILQSINLIRLL